MVGSFLPRLSAYHNSASCCKSQQEAESCRQSWQEAIFHEGKSVKEARPYGQSQLKPNIYIKSVNFHFLPSYRLSIVYDGQSV